MGLRSVCGWPVCLLSLFVTGALSLECNLLYVHLHELIWHNLALLNSMSNWFPMECVRESRAFELPEDILSHTQPQKRDIKEALYEISIQAFNIFTRYTFQAPWEEEHLKQIRIGLDQQLQYLEPCLTEGDKENKDVEEVGEGERKHLRPNNLELKSYFHRIHRFLRAKKYSRCAGEVVRVEIRRCFYYLQKFTAFLRRK